jgi:hypothetical protein
MAARVTVIPVNGGAGGVFRLAALLVFAHVRLILVLRHRICAV